MTAPSPIPKLGGALSLKRAANQLFREAIGYYVRAMYRQHLILGEDKRILLLAIHGLGKLDSYPLARALIRLTFSYLTADEYLSVIELARQEQRLADLGEGVPFK